MRSGKPIVENITSVGNKAIRNAANNTTLLFSEKSRVILYVSRILKTEKIKGNIKVAVSFEPNIIIENDVKPMKVILKGKMG